MSTGGEHDDAARRLVQDVMTVLLGSVLGMENLVNEAAERVGQYGLESIKNDFIAPVRAHRANGGKPLTLGTEARKYVDNVARLGPDGYRGLIIGLVEVVLHSDASTTAGAATGSHSDLDWAALNADRDNLAGKLRGEIRTTRSMERSLREAHASVANEISKVTDLRDRLAKAEQELAERTRINRSLEGLISGIDNELLDAQGRIATLEERLAATEIDTKAEATISTEKAE